MNNMNNQMNVRVFKMKDGRDIVAGVKLTPLIAIGIVSLLHPCELSVSQNQEGESVVNWAPYFRHVSGYINISIFSIKGWGHPSDNVLKEWLWNFG